MELGLDGKNVLITGGSKGIGKACALLFAAEGANVAITARTPGPLEAAVAEIGEAGSGEAVGYPGDMTRWDDVRRVVDSTIEQLGPIDILVTCAGSSPGGLIEELTEDDWESSLNLKFMGYVRAMRAVLPHMRERGSGAVVLVVGNDGIKPTFWETTAGAANAAGINVASSLAEQYGPYGVRVNTVNPGPVDTERWDGLEKAMARDMDITQEQAHEFAVSSIPLGRIAKADEVADLVVFLASERASFVNGAHVVIDGAQRKAKMDRESRGE
ncbi:MAG TPA: SDR family oxidoreductase [Acidimicrobiia bacterium]|nr:SDR family oxidoreductase [Acidimicrobiia bacterium]